MSLLLLKSILTRLGRAASSLGNGPYNLLVPNSKVLSDVSFASKGEIDADNDVFSRSSAMTLS